MGKPLASTLCGLNMLLLLPLRHGCTTVLVHGECIASMLVCLPAFSPFCTSAVRAQPPSFSNASHAGLQVQWRLGPLLDKPRLLQRIR